MSAPAKAPVDSLRELRSLLPADAVLSGPEIGEEYSHDESLTEPARVPDAVVLPETPGQISQVIGWARERRVAVTPRGSGTGLAGGATPRSGGIVMSLQRMNSILEVDPANGVAVVQAGVTLCALDEELAGHGLMYAVYPGEMSATIGGNIATNAGGMRAVRHGVTRHNVLGVQAVLGTGVVIRSGGKYVKVSSGYDLAQLLIGSEGTLGVVTEAILKLIPRPAASATVLAPFAGLNRAGDAASALLARHAPSVLEYLDRMSMAGILASESLSVSIPSGIADAAGAYLLVMLDDCTDERLAQTVESVGTVLDGCGALDVYVLPAQVAANLIRARERAFFAAKAAGAGDIIDVVVPRAQMPAFLDRVEEIAAGAQTMVVGCGHIGDGNVHLSVFQQDPATLTQVVAKIYAAGRALDGAVSGEHGIGTAKMRYFLEHTETANVDVQRHIKAVFDPGGILNPGALFPAVMPA
jgi:glycolate dehydrogenase FAD-linked subunit